MALELTIQEACKNPQNFMYIWADEKAFLQYIKPEWATVIRTKKANQIKLLKLSAEKYRKSYEEYTNAIREAFIATYDMTPANALIVLAKGGQVAGKDWEAGTFGIGELYPDNFNGMTLNDQPIKVNPENGHILIGAQDITDSSKTVYANVKGQTIPYQLFGTDGQYIFMSQYNKTKKKYYAKSYADGQYTYSARNGSEINASQSGDIWGAVLLSLEQFLNWLLSLFTGNTTNKEMINAENTLPNQQADGFVQEAGMGEAGMILLALAAGGALLAGGVKGKKKSVN